jgi:hypothetical protein
MWKERGENNLNLNASSTYHSYCIKVESLKVSNQNKGKCYERDIFVHFSGVNHKGELARLSGYVGDSLGEINKRPHQSAECKRIRRLIY